MRFGDKMPKSCCALTARSRVAQNLDRPFCTPKLGRSLPEFHDAGNLHAYHPDGDKVNCYHPRRQIRFELLWATGRLQVSEP